MKSKLLCSFVLSAAAVLAQSTSSITGQVMDTTGAAIPNAVVIVRAVDTGVENATRTNAEGYYTVPSLPPVNYQVSAEVPGFQKKVSDPFKLDVSSTARVDLKLHPKGATETIEVTERVPLVQTESGAAGSTVTEEEFKNMPLNGRNSLELAFTVPGVLADAGTNSDEVGIYQNPVSPGSSMNVGGGRYGSSAILADGVNSTSVGLGRSSVSFSPDTIQEVRVIVSSFSAQYGSTGGGIISTVSKGGTNQLHGGVFWFNRNPKFQARTFNSLTGPTLRRNEPGTNLSGPVWLPKIYDGRGKSFFFFSYEPKRWNDGVAYLMRLPTAEERQGDFRNTWGTILPIYQQVGCSPSPANCQKLVPINRASNTTPYELFNAGNPALAGKVIPKEYLDPAVQKVLSQAPLPNMPYDANGNNFFSSRIVTGKDNRWSIKGDHNISSRNRLSGRYINIPSAGERFYIADNPWFSLAGDRSQGQQATLTDTYTVSTRVVNELRLAYTFNNFSKMPPNSIQSQNFPGEYGLPNQTGWGVPGFSGLSPMANMGFTATVGSYKEHQYQIADDVTTVLGKHTITTGVDLRKQMVNNKQNVQYLCCGQYNFSANETNSGTTMGGGLAFASFLLGVPDNITNIRASVIPYYYQWKSVAAFVQDDFKATRSLTLNLGVRYQYNSPRAEKFGRQANLDIDHPIPQSTPSGNIITFNYLFAGTNGQSDYLEQPQKFNIEPRFGFAWQPKLSVGAVRSMVVRGGFGISHAPSTSRGMSAIPDFGMGSVANFAYGQWVGSNPAPSFQAKDPASLISISRNAPVLTINPSAYDIPSSGKICFGCVGALADPRVPSGSGVAFARGQKAPYMESWNLTTQFELPKSLAVTVGYMGSRGIHLVAPNYNMNVPDVEVWNRHLAAGEDPTATVPDPYGRTNSNGTLINVKNSDLWRPYPTVGNLTYSGKTNQLSWYNAGYIQADRRFSAGLSFRVNYTWAKSIDTGTNANDLGLCNSCKVQFMDDLKMNRSVSEFDQRHRINLVGSWELPFGKGKLLLGNSNRVVRALAGGWVVNSNSSITGGVPWQVFLTQGGLNNGLPGFGGPLRAFPDVIQGVPLKNPAWSKEVANNVPYLNPAAFAFPAYGKYGTGPRTLDYFRTPWRPVFNGSIFREIRPFENRKRYFQLRGEFFNLINHTWFTWNQNASLNIFSGDPPNLGPLSNPNNVNYAGAIPAYLFGSNRNMFKTGTRDYGLASAYNQSFGMFQSANNYSGRLIQMALKFYF